MDEQPNDLITVREAGYLLGLVSHDPHVRDTHVRRLIKRGALHVYPNDGMIGARIRRLVSRAEVEAWRDRRDAAFAERSQDAPERPDDLITLSEAAELLGFTGVKPVSSVVRLIERGRLRAYPYAGPPAIGYYPGRRLVSRAEVEALRDSRRSTVRRRLDQAREALAKLA